MKSKSIITYDARPKLSEGKEPFLDIMGLAAKLEPSQTLIVIAPFLPSPLIERLQADGLKSRVIRRSDNAWETHFSRE